MRAFVEMIEQIDASTKTNDKIDAIVRYLESAKEPDKPFALAILTGNKPPRPVKSSLLRLWTAKVAGLPLWLLEESYYVVGDLAETLALALPRRQGEPPAADISFEEVYRLIVDLKSKDEAAQEALIGEYWQRFSGSSLFVFNKLLTGNFRVGVSRKLVIKALARHLGMKEAEVEHRLLGKWNPFEESLESLFADNIQEEKHYLPYPFYLAYALEKPPEELGPISDWILEAKLDGIRGQIIKRRDKLFIWSRGEDLLTDKFPEFQVLEISLPNGTVLDGELIPWRAGRPLDFSLMQTRIGRKNISKRILEEVPVVMVSYDVLEWQGEDQRSQPLWKRKKLLEHIVKEYNSGQRLVYSPHLSFDNWEQAGAYRLEARLHHAEGLMLKQKDSIYESGRKKGGWWKWKTDPLTVDAVLIYAQSGSGRRANLYTDYTFAVWDEGNLVPFAKAYSGLTDKELVSMDNWIKRNTIERFGPVRSVKPEMVFELAFEGINYSKRHKSGLAVRFPRIVRWRKDKKASEANTLSDLKQLVASRDLKHRES